MSLFARALVKSRTRIADADRATIGIRVREDTARRAVPPTSRPLARVESGQRLTHTLRFTDESTPTRKAKPRGVQGAEVWLALADPNAPGRRWATPASSSRSVHAGGCKPTSRARMRALAAPNALRWVSTRGDKGPWSEVTTATVAA